MSVEPVFSHAKWAILVSQTIRQIEALSELKGGEYAGDKDRLANFRRNGERIGIPMEAIWHTYTAKHWDAIEQYIRDILTGKDRKRAEPLSSRLDDIIVYCILFKAMLAERGDKALVDLIKDPVPESPMVVADAATKPQWSR
jgi:hypothetical protein